MAIGDQSDISALLNRPDFFPVRLDLEHRAVVFVQMSRDTFRRSSFLDEPAILAAPGTCSVNLDELLEWLSTRAQRGPTHYILHGAFCGSTLLARYFETLPHCLAPRSRVCWRRLQSLETPARSGR